VVTHTLAPHHTGQRTPDTGQETTHDDDDPSHEDPRPDHPIKIEPSSDRVTVRSNGTVLADSTATLVLQESSYPDRVEITVEPA